MRTILNTKEPRKLRSLKRQKLREAYPIMTREHEVIGTMSPIPKGVFGGDDPHVVGHKVPER